MSKTKFTQTENIGRIDNSNYREFKLPSRAVRHTVERATSCSRFCSIYLLVWSRNIPFSSKFELRHDSIWSSTNVSHIKPSNWSGHDVCRSTSCITVACNYPVFSICLNATFCRCLKTFLAIDIAFDVFCTCPVRHIHFFDTCSSTSSKSNNQT